MSRREFRALLDGGICGLDAYKKDLLERFFSLVTEESGRQNLTRLLAPGDFFEGHVLDSCALSESGLVGFSAMDLGSGLGVPGIVCSILGGGRWILVESEGRKAEFLLRAVGELGLRPSVDVFSGRAEAFLSGASVNSVVARAVGPVSRIYGWIEKCSTWNNLILMKGPGWDKEWAEFEGGRFRGRLSMTKVFDYRVGKEEKRRRIVALARVPRGTSRISGAKKN